MSRHTYDDLAYVPGLDEMVSVTGDLFTGGGPNVGCASYGYVDAQHEQLTVDAAVALRYGAELPRRSGSYLLRPKHEFGVH